jgi:predicted GIY-YIG superfamily endonuclease
MKEKYFVYILKSELSGKIYTGFTTDLQSRMKQHNENAGGYTKNRGPWELIWYGTFKDREIAEDFEKYLKCGSGIAFARKRLIRL